MSKTVTFRTEDMVCTACEMLIESTLSAIDGVEKVTADYAKEQTTVTFDDSLVNIERLIEALVDAGHEASVA